jgi:hypothetical protein
LYFAYLKGGNFTNEEDYIYIRRHQGGENQCGVVIDSLKHPLIPFQTTRTMATVPYAHIVQGPAIVQPIGPPVVTP